MINVRFPAPAFNIKKEGEKRYIFDGLRKTWLRLTEEEWVRQNFVAYLIKTANYPAAFIAVEKEIFFNDLKKRFDVLVYNQQHQPWMLIECKAPHVTLSDAVLQQVLRYNVSVPVKYLVITNGTTTVGWEKSGERLNLISSLPSFE